MEDILNALLYGLCSIIQMLIDAVCVFIDLLLTPVANCLPTFYYDLSSIIPYVRLLYCFIDINYIFILFVSYITISISLIIINWILGLIPTIN